MKLELTLNSREFDIENLRLLKADDASEGLTLNYSLCVSLMC